MCFYNDYDWVAEEWHTDGRRAATPQKCYECRKVIAAGEFGTYLWQREWERCQTCENQDCECPKRFIDEEFDDYHECQCEKPDRGVEFEAWTCSRCSYVLEAIYRTEIDEGCRDYEAQPACGELWESIEHDNRHGGKYLARLRADFPGMALLTGLGIPHTDPDAR